MAEATKKIVGSKRRVLRTEVSFDYLIPADIPADKVTMYMREKTLRLCAGLSKNGVIITPVIPAEFK